MWADYLFKNIGLIYVWANLLCNTYFGLILFILCGILVAKHFLMHGFCLNLLSAFEMYISTEFTSDLHGEIATSASSLQNLLILVLFIPQLSGLFYRINLYTKQHL
jgi:hypothetical protein